MDWNAAIEKNRAALIRVVASLLAMAGPAAVPLLSGGIRLLSPAGWPGGRPTLPRRLHRAMLRLLRPAEAAARRLIVVAASMLVVEGPTRRRMPKMPLSTARRPCPVAPSAAVPLDGSRPLPAGFRLFDPPRRLPRRDRPASSAVPRITLPGWNEPFPVLVRDAPLPSDPVDATRLVLRLRALSGALDDLPRVARCLVLRRLRQAHARDMRRDASGGPAHRRGPLRGGRPPGQRSPRSRRPEHEVHRILGIVHGLALWALEPDTS